MDFARQAVALPAAVDRWWQRRGGRVVMKKSRLLGVLMCARLCAIRRCGRGSSCGCKSRGPAAAVSPLHTVLIHAASTHKAPCAHMREATLTVSP
mgnify:CR=1 FL=1